jgi:hypothetical protein
MPHEFQRARSMVVGQQHGIMTSGTPPHGPDIRARIAVNSRARPDSTGQYEDQLATWSVLVASRLYWVADQGFEP